MCKQIYQNCVTGKLCTLLEKVCDEWVCIYINQGTRNCLHWHWLISVCFLFESYFIDIKRVYVIKRWISQFHHNLFRKLQFLSNVLHTISNNWPCNVDRSFIIYKLVPGLGILKLSSLMFLWWKILFWKSIKKIGWITSILVSIGAVAHVNSLRPSGTYMLL